MNMSSEMDNTKPYECSDGNQGFTQWIDKEHHDKNCKRCKAFSELPHMKEARSQHV